MVIVTLWMTADAQTTQCLSRHLPWNGGTLISERSAHCTFGAVNTTSVPDQVGDFLGWVVL